MNSKKAFRFFLAFSSAAVLLAGCGSTSSSTKKELAEATEFSFDFNAASYSFKGVKNATIYFVKLYSKTTASDGTVSISSNALATTEMIKATDDNETATYTGSLDYTMSAGDYRAVVKAFATGGYKGSVSSLDGSSTMLVAPTFTAYWNTDQPGNTSIDIAITAGDSVTATYMVGIYAGSAASGTALYTNASQAAGSLNVKASDMGLSELKNTDTYTVSVQGNLPNSTYTQAKAVVAQVTTKQQQGGPGGGGGGFSLSPKDGTIDSTAATVTVNLTDTIKYTCTKLATPNAGSSYSYTCSDGSAIKGTLELKDDGTFVMTCDGGPVSNLSFKGTWSISGTTISLDFA
jgi:hypothetical protein